MATSHRRSRPPVRFPSARCKYNGKYYELVGKAREKCKKCKCTRFGWLECKKFCCLSIDETGKTKKVKLGQIFHNGCNGCECTTSQFIRCTLISCSVSEMCKYKNWQMLTAWADVSDERLIHVYDEEEGCRKKCKCIMEDKKQTMEVLEGRIMEELEDRHPNWPTMKCGKCIFKKKKRNKKRKKRKRNKKRNKRKRNKKRNKRKPKKKL